MTPAPRPSLLGVLLIGVLAFAWGCNGSQQQEKKEDSQPSVPGSSALPGASGGPMQRVEATVGTVGTRGRSYGGGIISEPVSQLFKQKDRIQLMQLEQALKLYKAEHGSLPRSHEEFMQKIVNNPQYGIRLPELPPGHRYVWDPKQGKLLVERPATSSQEKQP